MLHNIMWWSVFKRPTLIQTENLQEQPSRVKDTGPQSRSKMLKDATMHNLMWQGIYTSWELIWSMFQLSKSHLQNQRLMMPKDTVLLKPNMVLSDYIHFQSVGWVTVSIFKQLALIQPENWYEQSFPCQGPITKVKCQGYLNMLCCKTVRGSKWLQVSPFYKTWQ